MKLDMKLLVMLAVTLVAFVSIFFAPVDKRKQIGSVSAFSLVVSLLYLRRINSATTPNN